MRERRNVELTGSAIVSGKMKLRIQYFLNRIAQMTITSIYINLIEN